jgi:hypothetical protein
MESKCFCGEPIPQERAEFGFNTCVKHSSAKPSVGFMSYGHKTAGEVVIISGNDEEQKRIARRCYERKR